MVIRFIFILLFSTFYRYSYCQEIDLSNTTPFIKGELIFAFSNFDNNKLRVGVFPNFNIPYYFLIGRNNIHLIESGFNIRNLGIIYNDAIKYKFRILTFGTPLKYNLPIYNRRFSIGTEFNFAFAYKQKQFIDDDKHVTNKGLQNIVNKFQPALTAEYIISRNSSVKFSYYINNLFNESFTKLDGIDGYPFLQNSRVIYISIVYGVFNMTLDALSTRIL